MVADSGFESLENPSTQIRSAKFSAKLSSTQKEDTFERKDPQKLLGTKFWTFGHLTILLCALPSLFFCLTWQTKKLIPRLLYKATFIAVMAVNGSFVYRVLDGESFNFYSVLPMRMFQRFVLAIIWLITPPQTLNLIPYILFSLFYLTHESNTLLLSNPKVAKPASQAHYFISRHIIDIVSYIDIILLFQLTLNVILFRRFSIIALVVFLFIFRIRLMFSPPAYNAVVNIANRLDAVISQPKTPEKLRRVWNMVKIRFRAIDLTHSELHNDVTNEAIVRANLFNSLEK